jgi:hypothetical protein
MAKIDGDAIPDIVVGAGSYGKSAVEVWGWNSGSPPAAASLTKIPTSPPLFTTFADSPSSYVPVAVTAFGGMGATSTIVAVQGPGGTTGQIRTFNLAGTSPFTETPGLTFNGFSGPWFIAALNNPSRPGVPLSVANSHTGGTIVSGGTLQVTTAAVLPTGGDLTVMGSGILVLDSGLRQMLGLGGPAAGAALTAVLATNSASEAFASQDAVAAALSPECANAVPSAAAVMPISNTVATTTVPANSGAERLLPVLRQRESGRFAQRTTVADMKVGPGHAQPTASHKRACDVLFQSGDVAPVEIASLWDLAHFRGTQRSAKKPDSAAATVDTVLVRWSESL